MQNGAAAPAFLNAALTLAYKKTDAQSKGMYVGFLAEAVSGWKSHLLLRVNPLQNFKF